MNSPTRLLIADPEQIYRDGLKVILSRHEDMRVVALAETGPEACEKARRTEPDLVLLELGLDGMDGIAVTRAICAELPSTRIAVLSASCAEGNVLDAIKAGAHGYITKDVSVAMLIESIRAVARGEAVIPPAFAARLLQEFTALTRGRDDEMRSIEADRAKVTDREREVLRLLVQGATNRDIAQQLVITENTVKVHLRNILDKLHLRNRQQAAAFAVSSGLVKLPQEQRNGHQRNGVARFAGSVHASPYMR